MTNTERLERLMSDDYIEILTTPEDVSFMLKSVRVMRQMLIDSNAGDPESVKVVDDEFEKRMESSLELERNIP
jgi:hypothetical protein